MDKIFEPYLKELVTGRTEELAWKAEKLPEFKAEMEHLKDLRDEIAALVGEEKAGEFITAARGADVPIRMNLLLMRITGKCWMNTMSRNRYIKQRIANLNAEAHRRSNSQFFFECRSSLTFI